MTVWMAQRRAGRDRGPEGGMVVVYQKGRAFFPGDFYFSPYCSVFPFSTVFPYITFVTKIGI